MLEFMARKRACFRVRLNLLFSLARSRVLQRRFAAALFSLVRKKMPKKYAEGVRALSTPMGMGNDMYLFRLYEKSTKKVHEGLASPLDSRRRRKASAPLRSAGFTAILEISQFHQPQENAVFLYSLATWG